MIKMFYRLVLGVALMGLVALAPVDITHKGMAAAQTAAVTAEDTLDLEAWRTFATQSETQIADQTLATSKLEALQSELIKWREKLVTAEPPNAPRIKNLREQIEALGPAPAEGATESEELAARRTELGAQLTQAQAPGLAIEEASRRADGLVREINVILRDRDAAQLLRRDPAPLNPANWPGAVDAVQKLGSTLWGETALSANSAWRRAALKDALPVLLLALAVTAIAWWQGRRWIARLITRLQGRLPQDWRGVIALPISLLQVALPLAAVTFLSQVLLQTDALGTYSRLIVSEGLLGASLLVAVVLWLGWHIFPVEEHSPKVLDLPSERRAEGRFHITIFAIAAGFKVLIEPVFNVDNFGLGTQTVIFPLTIVMGILLFRLGQLISQSAALPNADADTNSFGTTMIALIGKAAMILGIAGPVLGAIGYFGLSNRLVLPGMATLALVGIFSLLRTMVYEVYTLVTHKSAEEAEKALLPVLISFGLGIAMLPLLALIWGMRSSDLLQYWNSFRGGFQLGDTRISPTDFVVLLLVFAIGYGVTRMIQKALKGTILPRTSIDPGGQNAIISGVGYVGYVVAALIAISAAGLNMSSLAMVASALSVGIGFGLQNIVQNFVSGIILLVERPVAEGDWVEVGGIQGTVRRISIRSTRLETFDRTNVIVPNASLISGTVTNFTAFNQTGRIIVPISVSYGTDTRRVAEVLREIAEAQPMVILSPPPSVSFQGFGADGLNFEIRAILRDVNFGGSVKSEINHQIAARFAEEGFEIPFAQREVRILNPEALPKPQAPAT